MDEDFVNASRFHGHVCPGLAMGYRMAKYVKEHYPRSEDEELVCIAENDSCSVDAVQHLLGCTAGKGNLIFKDHGKQAFTFYSRDKDKALRVYFKGVFPERMADLRERAMSGRLTAQEKKELQAARDDAIDLALNAPEDEVLSVRQVEIPAPARARIFPSIRCQECGEGFMEIKGRTARGKVLCMECFERIMKE